MNVCLMNRSDFGSGLNCCFIAAILCLPAATSAANDATAPDVLFIVVDDMNDWISLLDPEAPIKTPNLERLAQRGMLFTRAYCASPACNPSRAATLTGLRPSTTGVYGNKSDWRGALPGRRTIMQQFMAAGYNVRGAGKIFHHHLGGAFHDDESFRDFQHMRPQKYPPKKLNGAHAVRSERWRYIRYADGSEELYDHDADRNEWHNLTDEKRYAEVVASHSKWLPTTEAKQVPDLKKRKSKTETFR